MLPLFDSLRDLTTASIAVRMLLSVFCGGMIGIEREHRRRPAGFRTHILICLGAAMTTLTSQYLFLDRSYYTDIGRLGAQVIAGIGFIGAGAIIVKNRRRVKGLTTAAGLWTCAIVGLAVGAGFYEGALLVTVLILLAEIIFSKLEYHMLRSSPELSVYIECSEENALKQVIQRIQEESLKITDLEITRDSTKPDRNACAVFTLQMGKRSSCEKLFAEISCMSGVISVEEL